MELQAKGPVCLKKKLCRCLSIATMSMVGTMSINHLALAEDNTAEQVKRFDIPAGPLGKAISNYAAENGVRLTFDPALAEGKETQGLHGEYSVEEGFQKLLNDSGLEAIDDTDGGYFLVPGQEELPALGDDRLILETVKVRAQR
ncbi:MAG: STN domain-containing protein, partial [Pseudomonadota bacterium]|nr:STN domain-containing protein [Pseudomonadota bacterium]